MTAGICALEGKRTTTAWQVRDGQRAPTVRESVATGEADGVVRLEDLDLVVSR